MIGVFLCECGINIKATVDLENIRKTVEEIPEVSAVEIHKFLCSKPALEAVKDAIKRHGLKRVVIGACSPHMHEKTFMRTFEEAGLNKFLFTHANLREQCSWVHRKEEATPKAVDLMKAAIERAKELEELSPQKVKLNRDIMVVGGGIAGITTTLHLADAGYHVVLLERKPSVGGRMIQLSKVFPTLDCSPCILAPRFVDVATHPRVTLLTNAEVEAIKGSPGNFEVEVRTKARGVDIERCTRCALCEKVCPVEVPNEFEEGLYKRKAIYLPFPQAVPAAYVIDFENCNRCGKCVKVCPAEAINLEDEDKTIRQAVGAIILATGYELASLDEFLQYKPSPNCISPLQLERLIENELAAGRVLKTNDGRRVRSVAYLLCTGSRDKARGTPYCSRVCCPYSVKQAIMLKEMLPYMDVWIYYTDMRMSGKGLEEFYHKAKEHGVVFVHGRPGEVSVEGANKLEIIAEDIDGGGMLRKTFDMVIPCPLIKPNPGTKGLAEKLRVPLGPDGFLAEKHLKLDPVATQKPGVYAAGTVLGPKDVHESTVDGTAAAMKAVSFIGQGEYETSPLIPRLVGTCDKCGDCVDACTYGAITLTDEGPRVDPLSCAGCGVCVGVCKRQALELAHYTRKQLRAEVEGLLSRATDEVKIVGFFEDSVCYTTADTAGTSRLKYLHNLEIIRVPSTAMLSENFMLECLRMGADAVLLCEKEGKEAEIISSRVTGIQEKLERAGVEKERVTFETLMMPMYLYLPKLIEKHVKKIKSFGKLNAGARQTLVKMIKSEDITF